jgi:hypothetical protein
MQKKGLVLSVMFILLLVTGFFSCRKKEVTETPFSNLLGTWLLTQTATDDNGTGLNQTYVPVPKGQDYYKVFYPDSTGKDSDIYNKVLDPVISYRWTITPQDSIYTYRSGSSVVYGIVQVSSSTLILSSVGLTQAGAPVRYWNYYEKR